MKGKVTHSLQSILKILDPRLGTDSVISTHMHGYNALYEELLQKKLGMLLQPLRHISSIDYLITCSWVSFSFTLTFLQHFSIRARKMEESVTRLPNKAPPNKTHSRLRRKLMKLAIQPLARFLSSSIKGEKLPGQSMHFRCIFSDGAGASR